MYDTFQRFDIQVKRVTGTTINTASMFSEIVYLVLILQIKGVQTGADNCIRTMTSNWETIQNQPSLSQHGRDEEQVGEALQDMLKLVDSAILMDASRFHFFPPSPNKA